MQSTMDSCNVCGKWAKKRCSNCHKVYYCSKEHQKQDWPLHRNSCRNFEVKVSQELGYHLVATREIKVNEAIVTELPLAIGPSHRKRQKIYCIGCNLRDIHYPKDRRITLCPGCSWQVCHPECPGITDPERHGEECDILKRGELAYNDFPVSSQILPIRCLLVQRSSPRKFKMMKEMGERALKERHEKINEGSYGALQTWTFDVILNKTSGHFDDISRETVEKIYALLDLYGLWLGPPADENLVAFYGTASLLQQDCLPNTAPCFEEQPKEICYQGEPFRGRVTVRAIREIKKGEILTVIRGIVPNHSMLCTLCRNDELMEMRGLRCKCARCLDPTELGLHTGTLKCGKCTGWILPTDASKISSADWTCTGTCKRRIMAYRVDELITHLGDELQNLQETEGELKRILKKYEIYLHPRHHLCLTVKNGLAAVYGESFTQKSHATNMAGFTDAQLKSRRDTCNDALVSFKTIGPTTDTVAINYAGCLLNTTRIDIELLMRKYNAGNSNPEEIAQSVVKYRLNLRQLKLILRLGTSNEVRSCMIAQAAFDDRALISWAQEKGLKLNM